MMPVSRPLAGFLLLLLLVNGCASVSDVKTSPAQGQTKERVAQDQADCEKAASAATEPGALGKAAGYGILAVGLGALYGASEGVYWGALTRGNAGEAAWIGAAVGGGVGAVVGLVAGIKKGLEEHRQLRGAYEGCLKERGYLVEALNARGEGER